MSVKVTRDKVASTLKAIHTLVSKDVLVGVPSDRAERPAGEPINNAELGYIMEFGAPEANIPARPHLVPGIEHAEKRLGLRLKAGADAALRGDAIGAEKALVQAGIEGQNAVRAEITAGVSPALSPATIEARRRRGRTGTTPLLDTGEYRNSITFVIRDKT